MENNKPKKMGMALVDNLTGEITEIAIDEVMSPEEIERMEKLSEKEGTAVFKGTTPEKLYGVLKQHLKDKMDEHAEIKETLDGLLEKDVLTDREKVAIKVCSRIVGFAMEKNEMMIKKIDHQEDEEELTS